MADVSHDIGVPAGLGARLEQQIDGLEALAAETRAVIDRVSGADARRLTELWARAQRIAEGAKLLAAHRAKECAAWKPSGERSAAAWLARLSGCGVGEASRDLEGIGQIAEQPEVTDAVVSGEVSVDAGAEVARTANQASVPAGNLLQQARTSPLAATRASCRQARGDASAEDEAARLRRIHARRYLRCWTDEEGAGRLEGRFTPDAYAEIRAALSPFANQVFDEHRLAGIHERHECRLADALVLLARAAVDPSSASPDTPPAPPDPSEPPGPPDGGDPSGGPDPTGSAPAGPAHPAGSGDGPTGPATRRRRPKAPATIIVRVDHAALVRGWREGGECCEIDGVGPVPVATVQAMMSDAFLAAVVTDGIDVRRVVHLGRQPTKAMETALIVRDPTCVVPGCNVRTGLEIDHVDGWAATGVTRLDTLARLCHLHHAQKTYQGAHLHGPPGHWVWTPPADEPGPTASSPRGPTPAAPAGPPGHAAPSPRGPTPSNPPGPTPAAAPGPTATGRPPGSRPPTGRPAPPAARPAAAGGGPPARPRTPRPTAAESRSSPSEDRLFPMPPASGTGPPQRRAR